MGCRACHSLTTNADEPGPMFSTRWCNSANRSAIGNPGDTCRTGSPNQSAARCKPWPSPLLLSIIPFGNASGCRGTDTVGSPLNEDRPDSEQSRQLLERPGTV